MALVVLLRGVNVGGHRTFRPALLAKQLKRFDATSIGATGIFVIRRPVTQQRLRGEFVRRLPFETAVMICRGDDIATLIARNPFGRQRVQPDVVRFVSVLSRRPRKHPKLPAGFPSGREWLLKILGREDRFVFGLYRRDMKVIGYLGMVDRLFGVQVTTRNWNTITAIGRALNAAKDGRSRARHSG